MDGDTWRRLTIGHHLRPRAPLLAILIVVIMAGSISAESFSSSFSSFKTLPGTTPRPDDALTTTAPPLPTTATTISATWSHAYGLVAQPRMYAAEPDIRVVYPSRIDPEPPSEEPTRPQLYPSYPPRTFQTHHQPPTTTTLDPAPRPSTTPNAGEVIVVTSSFAQPSITRVVYPVVSSPRITDPTTRSSLTSPTVASREIASNSDLGVVVPTTSGSLLVQSADTDGSVSRVDEDPYRWLHITATPTLTRPVSSDAGTTPAGTSRVVDPEISPVVLRSETNSTAVDDFRKTATSWQFPLLSVTPVATSASGFVMVQSTAAGSSSEEEGVAMLEPSMESHVRTEGHHHMPAGTVAGIAIASVGFVAILAGVLGLLIFKRFRSIGSKTYDNKLSSDTCSYLDNLQVSYINNHIDTPKESSEEMFSLDNDSFLNSLEAMTMENYWAEDNRSTKV